MNLRQRLDRYSHTAGDCAFSDIPASPSGSGKFERLIHAFPPHHSHGSFLIDNLGGQFDEAIKAFLPHGATGAVDFTHIAFLDTETTGLSGGIGVCAFLIGIGYLSPDGFLIEQFLMHDFPAEPAMLEAFSDRLESFPFIASYNGRSFDVPILEGRLVLNRIDHTLNEKPHIDMLHPARRLWKHRLQSCSLKSLEYHALQCDRGDDIPGWMIPDAYFSYLRTGEKKSLEQILHHNRLDLLSLACITKLALGAIELPEKAAFEHGEDWYGLGTIFEQNRCMEKAAFCFERALQAGLPQSLHHNCRRILSLSHKRAGKWDEAVRLWMQTSAPQTGAANWFELEELAKYHEHRQHDLLSARDACRRALMALEVKAATSDDDVSRYVVEFEHRLNRLERKIRKEKLCERESPPYSHLLSQGLWH